jgi:hypothetical protein
MALNIAKRGQHNAADNVTMRIRQMDPKVYQRRANFAAFVVFMRLLTMKRRSAASGRNGFAIGKKAVNCKAPKFEWSDIDTGSPTTKCASTIDGSATTLAVTTGEGKMFTINDIIYNRETGESCRVTNVSSDNLTIVRGWGGSTAAAITADDVIVLVGNAFSEGSASPIARAYSPTEVYNLTQIFKRSVEATGTNEATEYYGDVNKLSFQKRLEWDQFLLERARSYFVGRRNEITAADGNPLRTTGGLDQFITANIYSKSTLTYENFMEFAKLAYEYGGEEKILICNSGLALLIQKFVLAHKISMEISPKSKEFGIKIRRLATIYGDMDFMIDQTMNQIYADPTGFALEPALMEEMVLRPDVWKENVQAPDVDGRKDQILGESGLKVISQERHAKIIIA